MRTHSPFHCFHDRLRGFMARHVGTADAAARPLGAQADPEFNRFALELFALQWDHVTAYRQFCQARRVSPGSVARWQDIPAMPTAAFKVYELTSLAEAERTGVFYSSGTTGRPPSRCFHNAASLALYEASLWPWFARHTLPELDLAAINLQQHAAPSVPFARIGMSLLFLTPPPALAPYSSLAHMFATVARALPANESVFAGKVAPDGAWRLELTTALAVLDRCVVVGQPVFLLGTAFSFVHLLDGLAKGDRAYSLPDGSRVLETGGYKGRSRSLSRAELHALITSRLGVPESGIIREYGMAELASQAYDRIAGHHGREARPSTPPGAEIVNPARATKTEHWSPAPPFHFPPWARVVVVSPETGGEVDEGETGLLRVFDLANVHSVLAVQTEDLAVRRRTDFDLLGRAESAEDRGCSLMML